MYVPDGAVRMNFLRMHVFFEIIEQGERCNIGPLISDHRRRFFIQEGIIAEYGEILRCDCLYEILCLLVR